MLIITRQKSTFHLPAHLKHKARKYKPLLFREVVAPWAYFGVFMSISFLKLLEHQNHPNIFIFCTVGEILFSNSNFAQNSVSTD